MLFTFYFSLSLSFVYCLFVRNGKGIRGDPDGLWSKVEGAVNGEGQLDVQGEEQWGGREAGRGEEEAKKSGEDFPQFGAIMI